MPGSSGWKTDPMDPSARARSAITLGVLAVLFVIGAAWAWSAVTEPFPEKEDEPACIDEAVDQGDRVTPGQIVVNVFNASSTEGLAGETMDALVRKGFAEGAISNSAVDVGGSGAVIWTTDPGGPSATLLQTYLGKGTEIVDQATAEPGITVVVGEGFPGIKDGKHGVKAAADSYVCSPPDQVAP
jgi:hypothetical protein